MPVSYLILFGAEANRHAGPFYPFAKLESAGRSESKVKLFGSSPSHPHLWGPSQLPLDRLIVFTAVCGENGILVLKKVTLQRLTAETTADMSVLAH